MKIIKLLLSVTLVFLLSCGSNSDDKVYFELGISKENVLKFAQNKRCEPKSYDKYLHVDSVKIDGIDGIGIISSSFRFDNVGIAKHQNYIFEGRGVLDYFKELYGDYDEKSGTHVIGNRHCFKYTWWKLGKDMKSAYNIKLLIDQDDDSFGYLDIKREDRI